MSRNSGLRKTNIHVRGTDTGNAGLEVDSFVDINARGGKATAPVGRAGAKGGMADGRVPVNATCKISCKEEVIDLAGASSAFSTEDLLPANAIILPIVTHCIEEFTTPTTYDLGDESSNTRFATALANDTVAEGPKYAASHWDASPDVLNTTAQRVKVTPNAAGQGKVLVQVFYISLTGGLA